MIRARVLVTALFVGLLATTLASPTSARAQGKPLSELNSREKKELLALLQRGNRAFDDGKYKASCEAYAEAIKLSSLPDLYYRTGLCREKLGQLKASIEAYETFLRLEPRARDRGRIEKEIARLKERLERASVVTLRIESSPTGAMIVDAKGNELGQTPLTLERRPGDWTLRARLRGYQPISRSIKLQAGQEANLRFELRPLPRVTIRSSPEGAQVLHRGKPIGRTPLEREMEVGRHEFILRKEGYADETLRLELRPGDERPLRATLAPLAGPSTNWLSWGLLGSAVLAGGLSAGMYFSAQEQARKERTTPRLESTQEEIKTLNNQAENRQIIGHISLLGSIVLATGAGLAWVLVDDDEGKRGRQLSVTPTLLPGGGHASVYLRF